jgi:hypothetical protein
MIQRWEAAYPTGAGANLVDELCAAAGNTGPPMLRSVLAMALVEAGRPRNSALPCTRPQGFPVAIHTVLKSAGSVRLGETELVTRLRKQLLPYRQLNLRYIYARYVWVGGLLHRRSGTSTRRFRCRADRPRYRRKGQRNNGRTAVASPYAQAIARAHH